MNLNNYIIFYHKILGGQKILCSSLSRSWGDIRSLVRFDNADFGQKRILINSILFDHNKHHYRILNSSFKSFDWLLNRVLHCTLDPAPGSA